MASLAYKPEPKSLISEATEMAEDRAVAAIADRQRQQLQYERKLRKVFAWAVIAMVLVSAAGIAVYHLLV